MVQIDVQMFCHTLRTAGPKDENYIAVAKAKENRKLIIVTKKRSTDNNFVYQIKNKMSYHTNTKYKI